MQNAAIAHGGGPTEPGHAHSVSAEAEATRAAIARTFRHLPAYFLSDATAVKKLHDLIVDRAQRGDKVAHAAAEATLFRLKQLDQALALTLANDNLLFDGVTASGKDILEQPQRD